MKQRGFKGGMCVGGNKTDKTMKQTDKGTRKDQIEGQIRAKFS